MKAIKTTDLTDQKIKEHELIRRIISGEKALFEILVRRNNQKLYRVIRSYLKDEAEVEDAMQNSYLKAYANLHQFKLNASFSTWLTRIGINEALARLKEKGRIYHLNEQASDRKGNTMADMPDRRQLNPQDKMIRKEANQLLEMAIDRLEQKYRTVYILKEVEDMSLKEIALALDITVNNAKVRLHRAKEKLKENLYALTNDKTVFEFGSGRCDRITERVMRAIG